MGRADRRARKQANKQQAKENRYSEWRRIRRRRRLTTAIVWLTILGLVAGVVSFVFAGDDATPVAATDTTAVADTDATTTTLPEDLAAVECTGDEMPEPEGERPTYDAPPEMEIDTAKTYRATVETNCGTMVWELDPDAPGVSATGVNNFVALARDGFYDRISIHRVIAEFVIQGGDPEGTGTGGPGYEWGSGDDTPDNLTYAIGDLAYANANSEATTGSQFFVITGPQGAALPGNYIKFGKVVEGLEIAQRMSYMADPAQASGQGSPPIRPLWIEKVTIEEV